MFMFYVDYRVKPPIISEAWTIEQSLAKPVVDTLIDLLQCTFCRVATAAALRTGTLHDGEDAAARGKRSGSCSDAGLPAWVARVRVDVGRDGFCPVHGLPMRDNDDAALRGARRVRGARLRALGLPLRRGSGHDRGDDKAHVPQWQRHASGLRHGLALGTGSARALLPLC